MTEQKEEKDIIEVTSKAHNIADLEKIAILEEEVKVLNDGISDVAQKYQRLMKPFKSDTIIVYKDERLRLKIYVNPEKKIAEVLEVKKDDD